MLKPNYKDGSIVNLMSSLGRAMGWKSPYNPLKYLKPSDLSKNVVLLILDGMGYEYLMSRKKSFLKDNVRAKITSAFPPTTASCIMTFQTGLPAQQTGFTGWFVYLKELGTIATILPFNPRHGGPSFEEMGIKRERIYTEKEFWKRIKVPYYFIMPEQIVGPDSKKGRKTQFSYNTIPSFFKNIKKAVKTNKRKKFIYAYSPYPDSKMHHYGVNSKETSDVFMELDKQVQALAKSLKGTDTTLIVVADHGLIDVPNKGRIDLRKHPKFVDTMSMPMTGDSRMHYCYVKPGREKDFKAYVKKHFKKACDVYKSSDIVKQNYYGLFNPHKELHNRVGDYILAMKEGYVMRDTILGEEFRFLRGNHGGMSTKELYVPLIVFNL